MEITLLGATEARVSGVSVSLSPLERNLLAVLALSKGTVISTDRLIDCLWGDRPPATPRSRVQGLVSSLRRKIGGALVTRHPGYLLEADEIAVDLDECEDLARQARLADSPAQAAQYLREALALWRGEPLDGVSAPGTEFDRVRLEELRLALLEERYAVDLELGHHVDLVAELTAAVSAHPLRERLAGLLMLALYRCNRQADSLKVYQALRDRLAEELGSDPCAHVREVHAMILRGDEGTAARDPASATPPKTGTVSRPAQLPAGVGHFTGRETELTQLTRVIAETGNESRVLMVSGAGGLGKTALVVQWAHTVADRFPDGQIFVDLHGQVPLQALSPRDALGAALGALGVPKADIPVSADERAALYRTLISGRRMLVVADDAGGLEQMLPLVPPAATSQLVATSRRRLAVAAHHAAQAVTVKPMTPQNSRDLLARIVGAERLRDPAAAELVRWCGGWPLAIRIAGTRLAARPWQPLSLFVEELDDMSDLTLDGDPRSVRAALAGAHMGLSPAAAHLFGRLGLNRTASIHLNDDIPGSSRRRVRRLLDELAAVHLIAEVGQDRYLIHEVVRRFARQCATEMADRDSVDDWMRRSDGRVADSQPI
ncbi:AfsR/SARP family transcriptional regulator [Nonomuraea aurantiaca]|uniref:AfsR/SARP family transcriptional regulator n=1 Tax=Nonomuraea aurantiaca TaxID=2878562 RepID=UPI001CDA336A|nr:AfsR/SARP family transcriptional regulator [Nonomuraea aurantiaca]MCA2220745.1 winged helix-turn-helix domain-containing protein [Nonomuraea aurantiaca]